MTTTDTHTFKVGDRVRHCNGRPATIWQPAPQDAGGSATIREGGYVIRFDTEQVGQGWRGEYHQGQRMWYAMPSELTPLAEPQEATQSDARPTNGQSLQSAEIQALKAQITAMQDDLATIGEHLKRTAERHEWCDEYEEHLSRLVADLSEHSAKTLHDAAKRVQTFYVDYSWSTAVEAVDAEQAQRIAEERFEDGTAEYGNWTVEEAE